MSPARLRSLLLAALAGLTWGGAACTKPCEDLEKKVCDVLKDTRRCELIQEPERRELLSDEACSSILRAIDRR